MERRRFCSVLAAASAVAVPSPVSAQSNIQITGTINSAIGADVGGIELFFQHVETGSSFTYTVPESGDIDFTVSEAGTHRVRLFNTSNRNDNVPLVYSFGQQNIVEGGNSFNFTIPQSYETQIQCIDSTGDPVERLSVTLRADGTSPGTNFTTSKQGYVKFQTTTETKLQLAGLTEVEVESTTSDNRQILDTINVTEPTVAELTVRDPEEFTYNFKLVEADPEAGFYHPYLLYRPNLKQDSERPLYVEPLNAPAVSDRKELHNQLISSLDGKTFAGARRNEYPGIIAGFPRTENDGPDHIQTLTLPSYRPELFTSHYRLDNLATKEFSAKSLTRVDKQLLAMIEDAKSRLQSESYSIADKVHMSAFSGGGHFCNRFAFLHPTEVRTLTTGAADILPLPKNSHDATVLPYPLGTADYEELTGREFNKEAWAKINRYIYILEVMINRLQKQILEDTTILFDIQTELKPYLELKVWMRDFHLLNHSIAK